MISSTMGKSPRTGRRLLPPMYSRKATDQTQETTCAVQSCCYLYRRVMLMIGQIQQQQKRNIQFQKIETRILIWNIFFYQSIHNMLYFIYKADLTRGRLDPDSFLTWNLQTRISLRRVRSFTGMGRITGMDYRNGLFICSLEQG